MRESPQVSVIMSVYNGEEHLSECIESILAQSLSDFEFIVVNDASTDNTANILAQWQEKDQRIRILSNVQNRERSISRNRAITAARAELVAIMDADDHALPERLAIQTAYLQAHPEVQILGGDMLILGETKRWSHPETNEAIRAALFFDCALFHPTVMLRKEILRKTKNWYDPALPPTEDYGLWASFLPIPEARFANIPTPLTAYRLSDVPREEYEQKQFSHANLVRAQILQRLGLDPGAENLIPHLALLFGSSQAFGISPARCAEYGNILLAANERARFCAPEALEAQVAARLKRVFAGEILERKKNAES